ncbi:MAG: tRNA (guanosine(37)-N1)-methyltransferase TrmD [Clostridia bacterium]|nr:tRNA (guanosine(37)-N1)-methyltransferase TrmD [Clostridia bacterium]
MHFVVLTLFKEMFDGFLNSSIIKRAIESGKVDVKLVDIRDFSDNKNRKVDDTSYGGGAGMVLMAEPVAKAIDYAIKILDTPKYEVIYMSPRGKLFSYNIAKEMSDKFVDTSYIVICGHYEGIDERVLDEYNALELSIGDYVLTGGELPAMVLVDCVSRLVSGVINEESLKDESHTNGLLEYPQYTKPQKWRGKEVPDVLITGNHQNIDKYRKEESLKVTMKNRPELLKKEK